MADLTPIHEIGTRKELTRFAFFPMFIQGQFVWFKKYTAIKEYNIFEYDEEDWDETGRFFYAWKTIERKIIID